MLPHPKTRDYLAWHRHAQRPYPRPVHHYLQRRSASTTKAVFLRDARCDEMASGYQSRDRAHGSLAKIGEKTNDIVDLIRVLRGRLDSKIIGIKNRGHLIDDHQTQKHTALKTMIGGVAHHFNNLFMGIQSNVSLMLCQADISQRNVGRLKRIEKLVQSESMLTNDLLNHLVNHRPGFDAKRRSQLAIQIVRLSNKIWPGPDVFDNRLVWADPLKAPDHLEVLTESINRIFSRLLWEIRTIITVMLRESHHWRYEFNRLIQIEKYVLRGLEVVEVLFSFSAPKTRQKFQGHTTNPANQATPENPQN